ncbi:MAG TPA: TolC family protein, partial [Vicinamibacterales bacterium]
LASFFADGTDAARIVAVPGPAGARDAPIPSVEELLGRAESTRGELLALRQEVEAAGLSARAADRRQWPEPEIVAGMKSATFPIVDRGTVIAVNASLPIFDHGGPERALARARASQAEARAASMRQVLVGQVAALREAVVQRRVAAARYRAEAVSSAAEIERIAQVSYEAGERGILELLDAYRLGASARVRQVLLDSAVRESAIELEFLTGWEMPE